QRYLNLRQAAALPQLAGTGITITTLRTAAKRCELRTIMTMHKILTCEVWLEEWLTCHVQKVPASSGKIDPRKVGPAAMSSEMERSNSARDALRRLTPKKS